MPWWCDTPVPDFDRGRAFGLRLFLFPGWPGDICEDLSGRFVFFWGKKAFYPRRRLPLGLRENGKNIVCRLPANDRNKENVQ